MIYTNVLLYAPTHTLRARGRARIALASSHAREHTSNYSRETRCPHGPLAAQPRARPFTRTPRCPAQGPPPVRRRDAERPPRSARRPPLCSREDGGRLGRDEHAAARPDEEPEEAVEARAEDEEDEHHELARAHRPLPRERAVDVRVVEEVLAVRGPVDDREERVEQVDGDSEDGVEGVVVWLPVDPHVEER